MEDILLYHGTDIDSALDILLNGLDAAIAASYNGAGEFWATKNLTTAMVFAESNLRGGMPALFCFAIQDDALRILAAGPAPRVILNSSGEDFEFLPSSFPDVNPIMRNRKVIAIS